MKNVTLTSGGEIMAKNVKKKSKKLKLFRLIVIAFVLSIVFSTISIGTIYAMGEIWTDESKLEMAESSVLYDISGKEAMKFFRQNRDTVPLEKIPDLLIKAFIATEDQRFYEHHGVDPLSIARALVVDVMAGSAVQGGSTITQQLAKNTFLSSEKALSRKFKEAVISFTLERKYSKDQIMEMYLNRIYFGHGAYGVQAASQKYFNKNVDELSLGEIAMLAGLPKAPSHYSPFHNEEKAKDRRNIVLKLLVEQGYVSEEEREKAQKEEFALNEKDFNKDKEFITYADYVVEEAVKLYGLTEDEVYRGGYHIYTHLQPGAQRSMEKVYANDDYFPKSPDDQKVQSAMVILNPKTGGIAAMIGGRDYQQKALNRALVTRQPGSAFKPIAVYGPAMEEGWHPYDLLRDEKIAFGDYEPENYNGKYQGRVTMIEAVKKSINLPAVWLLDQIGVHKGFAFAENMGFNLKPEDKNLSLALGGLHRGVSPLHMAQAYGAFNNNGIMHSSHAIIKIVSKDGAVVAEAKPAAKKVMSEKTAYYMTEMLETVVSEGTGERAGLNRPTAGKTGTTQSGFPGLKGNRDAWFAGYTPELVGAVWLGYDKTDEKHLLSSGGGRVPAQIFKAVMTEALKNRKVTDFKRPEGVPVLEPPVILKAIEDLNASYSKEDRLIHLNWTPLYSVTDNKVGYKVFRKDLATMEFVQIGDTLEPTWVDEPNMEGEIDEYYVIPYNLKTGEEGPPSNMVQVEAPSESLLDLILPPNQNPNEPPKEGENEGEAGDEGGEGGTTGDGANDGGTTDGGTNDGGSTEDGNNGGGTNDGSNKNGGTSGSNTNDGGTTEGGSNNGETN
jgi:penicillin-binding protein 2A